MSSGLLLQCGLANDDKSAYELVNIHLPRVVRIEGLQQLHISIPQSFGYKVSLGPLYI